MYAPPRKTTYDATDPVQCSVDIYTPLDAAGQRDAVIFIHGGAWRSGDKSDHTDIPALLADAFTKHGDPRPLPFIVIPNYRLSANPAHPDRIAVSHPTHTHDVARALHSLTVSPEWPSITRITLIGHSCGAHILSHLFLNLPLPDPTAQLTALRASLTQILPKTTSLGFLDGIYSVRTLITEYPSYRFFIDAAFGADPTSQYPNADVFVPNASPSPSTPAPPEGLETLKRIIIAHASADELLTPTQGLLFLTHLRQIGYGDITEWDDGTLRGTHDGCLHDEGLGELLYRLLA